MSIKNLFNEVNANLIDRSDEVRAAIRAAVAREHLLLVGPPGTAKSMLCNALAAAIGCRVFTTAVDPHTEPEHIFGPESFRSRMEDKLEKCTDGYAADAELVFLDEIFKASKATRSHLLPFMQERVYFNGSVKMSTPLRTLIAASNEIPDDHADAVYDRFLIRRFVDPVHPSRLKELLFGIQGATSTVSTITEWDQAHEESRQIPVSDEVKDVFEDLVAELNAKKIRPGDRRLRKSIGVLQAEAWLQGDSEVTTAHLECLGDVLWINPEERKQSQDIVLKHSDPVSAKAVSLEESLNDIVTRLGGSTDESDATEALGKMKSLMQQAQSLPTSERQAELVKKVVEQQKRLKASIMGIDPDKIQEIIDIGT